MNSCLKKTLKDYTIGFMTHNRSYFGVYVSSKCLIVLRRLLKLMCLFKYSTKYLRINAHIRPTIYAATYYNGQLFHSCFRCIKYLKFLQNCLLPLYNGPTCYLYFFIFMYTTMRLQECIILNIQIERPLKYIFIQISHSYI